MDNKIGNGSLIWLMLGILWINGTICADAKTSQILPAELAWISTFSSQVEISPQGIWQLKLSDGIDMVYVPAGEFLMGSKPYEPEVESAEMPIHRIWVKGMLMGKFEVTRKLWQQVMGGAPVDAKEALLPQGNVSYLEIEAFLAALRSKSGLMFRLPTEAEWEKCCRAGTRSMQYGTLDKIAWYADNSDRTTHVVGGKQANFYGIYDMLGNVWEWCSDWLSDDYYRHSPYANPQGPERGSQKVSRGGGFQHRGRYLRAAHRNALKPQEKRIHTGFRLALDAVLQ